MYVIYVIGQKSSRRRGEKCSKEKLNVLHTYAVYKMLSALGDLHSSASGRI